MFFCNSLYLNVLTKYLIFTFLICKDSSQSQNPNFSVLTWGYQIVTDVSLTLQSMIKTSSEWKSYQKTTLGLLKIKNKWNKA